MYNRVIDFLKEHDILFKYQFGFRQGYSTYLALTVLVDKLVKSLENGDYVVGVFLDFSKAFDTGFKVVHNLFGKSETIVTYNGVKSKTQLIRCGVPQGSILGPLLFLIYINALANVCKYTMPISFADDSNLFLNGKSLKDIEQKINSELAEIAGWLKVNKLTLNVDKTVCMVFTTRHKEYEVNIKFEGKLINRVTKTKFLGVIIDDKLNWKAHISYISGKISRAIGVIIKARNLGKGALLSLYYTLIYPYLTYCNQVWGSTYKYSIDTLTKLQKKAVRLICSVKPFSHTDGLYKELGLLKVTEIYHFLVGQFMFRYQCYPNSLMNISQNIAKFTATAPGSQNYFDYLIIKKIWEDIAYHLQE